MKKSYPKPVVGQKLWRLNVGNAARYDEQKLVEVTVTKVGRKYFTVTENKGGWTWDCEFHLEDWREKSDYSSNYVLYATKQEYIDLNEARYIGQYIERVFRYGNTADIPLEGLRQIKAVIDTYSPALEVR